MSNNRTIALIFGRCQPFTVGHLKLIEALNSQPADEKLVYLSHTQNNKKDPLSYEDKIQYAAEAVDKHFSEVDVVQSPARTIIEVLQELSGSADKIIVVAGGDRVEDFTEVLNRYNGQPDKSGRVLYSFSELTVKSAGDRDPDADDVTGMSASKARRLAQLGHYDIFSKAIPLSQESTRAIYDMIRSTLGVLQERRLRENNAKIFSQLNSYLKAKKQPELPKEFTQSKQWPTVIKSLKDFIAEAEKDPALKSHANNLDSAFFEAYFKAVPKAAELLSVEKPVPKEEVEKINKKAKDEITAASAAADEKIARKGVQQLDPARFSGITAVTIIPLEIDPITNDHAVALQRIPAKPGHMYIFAVTTLGGTIVKEETLRGGWLWMCIYSKPGSRQDFEILQGDTSKAIAALQKISPSLKPLEDKSMLSIDAKNSVKKALMEFKQGSVDYEKEYADLKNSKGSKASKQEIYAHAIKNTLDAQRKLIIERLPAGASRDIKSLIAISYLSKYIDARGGMDNWVKSSLGSLSSWIASSAEAKMLSDLSSDLGLKGFTDLGKSAVKNVAKGIDAKYNLTGKAADAGTGAKSAVGSGLKKAGASIANAFKSTDDELVGGT